MADGLELLELSGNAPGAGDTIERTPNRRIIWVLLAAVGILVVVAVAGALLDSSDDPPPASATPTTAATELDTASAQTPPPTSEPTAAPSRQQPSGFTPPLPDAVPAFDAPDDLVIFGHTTLGRLATIRPDGTVTEWLPNSGAAFLPQARGAVAVVGLMNVGGTMIVIDGNGDADNVLVDNRDAPVYVPNHDGTGFVVHGTWLGKIRYIDNDATELEDGPAVARGTKVLADTAPGLAVLSLDGNASIIDRTTGAELHRLDTVPLAVAGEHQVVVTCDNAVVCRVEIQRFDGTTTGVLDIDPVIAQRLVLGISPTGDQIAYLHQQRVRIVDSSGDELVRIQVRGEPSVVWSGDTVLVVDDQTAQLWTLGDEAAAEIEILDVIDPDNRGIALLRTR